MISYEAEHHTGTASSARSGTKLQYPISHTSTVRYDTGQKESFRSAGEGGSGRDWDSHRKSNLGDDEDFNSRSNSNPSSSQFAEAHFSAANWLETSASTLTL